MTQDHPNWRVEFIRYVEEACENSGEVDCRSYSGRSMYGKTCLSINGEAKRVRQTLTDAINNFVEETWGSEEESVTKIQTFVSALMNYKEDSFGLDKVIYWPHIPYDKDDNDIEENGG